MKFVDEEEDDGEYESTEEFLSSTEDEQERGCAPPWMHRLVDSHKFQLFIGFLIVLNMVVIALQTDNEHVVVPVGCDLCQPGAFCFSLWSLLNKIFLVIFTMELVMRMMVFGGRGFFCTEKDRGWNWMDFVIVVVGVVAAAITAAIGDQAAAQWCTDASHKGRERAKWTQVVFLLRALRILRVIRIFRSFPQLNMLARGLMESIPQVATVMILLLMLVFIISILTTSLIGQDAGSWSPNNTDSACDPECEEGDADEIRKYFGKVGRSMFTLFQFMTLDDWVYVSQLVAKQMPMTSVILFYTFVVAVAFVILSLFSGVMVDHMNDVREKEVKENQLLAIQEAEELNKTFQTIFGWDEDSPAAKTNTIGEEEFAEILSRPSYKLAAAASDLDLTRAEAKELFAFWDKEHDKRISWNEFRSGLEEYREGLTVKKIMLMKSRLKKLLLELKQDGGDRLLAGVPVAPASAEQKLDQADARMRGLERRMMDLEEQVKRAQRACATESGLCSPFSACSGGTRGQ